MKKVWVNTQVTEETKTELKAIASGMDRSLAYLLREAIKDLIEKYRIAPVPQK